MRRAQVGDSEAGMHAASGKQLQLSDVQMQDIHSSCVLWSSNSRDILRLLDKPSTAHCSVRRKAPPNSKMFVCWGQQLGVSCCACCFKTLDPSCNHGGVLL